MNWTLFISDTYSYKLDFCYNDAVCCVVLGFTLVLALGHTYRYQEAPSLPPSDKTQIQQDHN